MPPPIRRADLAQHPAISEFVRYVELHTGQAVDLDRIRVETQRQVSCDGSDPECQDNIRNDGVVELTYAPSDQCHINDRCSVFYGKIHGPGQSILLRHSVAIPQLENLQMGTPPRIEHVSDLLPLPVAGACATVRHLGGSDEVEAVCEDGVEVGRYGAWAASGAIGFEFWGTILNKARGRQAFPLTRWLIQNFRPAGSQIFPAADRAVQMGPGVVAGGAAMLGTQLIADPLLGLEANRHHDERFALGVLAGHGANLATTRWLSSRGIGTTLLPPASTVPAATAQRMVRSTVDLGKHLAQSPSISGIFESSAVMEEAMIREGARLRPMSLGSGLISAALVDTLIGPYLGEEGSTSREVLRGSAFFLPQVYRGVMGSRTLAFAERPRVRGAGRALGWGATIAFLSDLAHMGYRYLSVGPTEMGRDHALYRRAQELQDAREGSSLWRGFLNVIAPSLTESMTVSDDYVTEAQNEFALTAQSQVRNARQVLLHNLIHGGAGQNRNVDFYQRVNLDWLRGDNDLTTIQRQGHPDWYLGLVAEDLGDPNLYRTYLEGKNREQQIRFIQNQYEWDLSAEDVQEILARIGLHHARSQIADIQHLMNPGPDNLASLFDEEARLRPGMKDRLLNQLFTDFPEVPTEEQILALRQVALVVRVRQLREDLRGAQGASGQVGQGDDLRRIQRDLNRYTSLARELGLINESGDFVPSEIYDHAQRINVRVAQIESRPTTTGADLIREVYGFAAANQISGH